MKDTAAYPMWPPNSEERSSMATERISPPRTGSAPLPPITEIQRLTIRPGDRLIAKYDGHAAIGREEAREIAAQLRRALQLPDAFPIAVADAAWHFVVVDPSGTYHSCVHQRLATEPCQHGCNG